MSNGEDNLEARLKSLEASAKKAASDAERSANNAKKSQAAADKAKNAAQKAEKGATAAQEATDESDKAARAARQAAEKARDDATKARNDAASARNDASEARDDATRARDDIMSATTTHHEQTEASMRAHAWTLLDTVAMVTRSDADNAVHEAEDAARRAQRSTAPVVEDLGTARHGCDMLLTLSARHSSDETLLGLQGAASEALERAEHDVENATSALVSAEASHKSARRRRDQLVETIGARLADREAQPEVEAIRTELFDARATVLAAAAEADEAAALAEDSARRAAEAIEQIQTLVEDANELHPAGQQNPVNTRDDIRSLFFGRTSQPTEPVDGVVDPESTEPVDGVVDPESAEPVDEVVDPESTEPADEVVDPAPWYWWHRVDGHGIPDGALRAGEFTEREEPFFIAQIEHRGGVHTGKVWGRYGEARVPYGGMEIVTRNFSVLMARPGAPFSWESASNGSVPAGALQGGRESNGTPLFIARAPYGGDGIHPGKVRAAFRGANIGWGGKEIKVNPYEVLVFDEARATIEADTSTPWVEAPAALEPVHAEPEPIHAEPVHAVAAPEPVHSEPEPEPEPAHAEPEPVHAEPEPAPARAAPEPLPTTTDAAVEAQLDALASMMSTPIDNRSTLRSMFSKFNS